MSKREDLLLPLQRILIRNLAYFSLVCDSMLIKIKLYVFYGLYLDILLQNPEFNETYLRIIFELINPKIKETNGFINKKAVILQACDSLNEVISHEGFYEKNLVNFEVILQEMLKDLVLRDQEIYFEALQEIIIKFQQQIMAKNEIFQEILNKICEKIQFIAQNEENLLVICFEILKKLAKNLFQSQNDHFFDFYCKKLFELFLQEKIFFAEYSDNKILEIFSVSERNFLGKLQIIEIIRGFVKKYNKFSKYFVNFLRNILLLFEKQSEEFHEIYEFV